MIRASLLLLAILLGGCAHHRVAPGEEIHYWDEAVSAQCHDQPKLDWCHHAK
jgi:hypothetical protein